MAGGNKKKKVTRPTVQSVAHELSNHSVECAERWRTCFKHLEKLDNDIETIKTWIIVGLGTIAITFIGFALTQI